MPFSIDRVVPWGRSAPEYQAMFALDEADLGGRILGCGDGPASFNAEMTAQGRAVVSVDPLYAVSAASIQRRVEGTFDEVMDQMRQNAEEFVWTHVPSIEELGRRRMDAMRRFLADYPRGKAEGRYVEASLPDLPFDDGAFDLALSSHLLFLYSEQFDLAFHIRALKEMLRVAAEVRIFPLLQIGGRRLRMWRKSSTPSDRKARTRRSSRWRTSFSGAGIECCGCDVSGCLDAKHQASNRRRHEGLPGGASCPPDRRPNEPGSDPRDRPARSATLRAGRRRGSPRLPGRSRGDALHRRSRPVSRGNQKDHRDVLSLSEQVRVQQVGRAHEGHRRARRGFGAAPDERRAGVRVGLPVREAILVAGAWPPKAAGHGCGRHFSI